jgi:hypothetical protein
MPSKKFGKVPRPHFEILDWKQIGDGGSALPPSPAPQLPGPTSTPTPEAPAPEAPKPTPTQKAKSKKPISLADYTLAAMGEVKKPTTEERLNDSLDDLPFDKK